MSKTELVEKLTIATICNEATDCILKQIVAEDVCIENYKTHLDRLEKSIDESEPESQSEKIERRITTVEVLLKQSQDKRQALAMQLRPKIDTAAIKMNYENIVKEFLRIYKAGKSGKALLACQGQGMDGYSQLASYNSLAGDIIEEQVAHSKEKEG